MTKVNIEKILNQKLEQDNKLLRKLVKVLLRDYVGDLCFMSNKSLELELQDCNFKTFLKSFLRQTIDRLDQHYEKVITDKKMPDSFYEELFKELKNPIKTIKTKELENEKK